MTDETNSLPRSMDWWQKKFIDIATGCSDALLKDAKKFPTYGEATQYVHKVNGQAKGIVDNCASSAGMRFNDIVCELTLNRLYEEERKLPIRRGESDGD